MKALLNMKCKYSDSADVEQEVLTTLGMTFAQVYASADKIAALSLALKKANGHPYCVLPFCHTLEAEALGANIIMGDETAGSRAGEYAYDSIEDLLDKSLEDGEILRIRQMMDACVLLNEQGEQVVFMISGPFTIFNCLINPLLLFKTWRKNEALIMALLDHLSHELLVYIEKLCDMGVDIISFADPGGCASILGPRYLETSTAYFTAPFLQKAATICQNKTHIYLCPLSLGSLLHFGWAEYDKNGNENEKDGIISNCIKNPQKKKTIVKLKL